MIDTINKVYKNIYGVSIRQPFKIDDLKRMSKEIYSEPTPSPMFKTSLSGGATTRRRVLGSADESNVVYDSPYDYASAVSDTLFIKWLNAFKIVHIALKPQSKTIIVRPSDSEIKSQINEITEALKKSGIVAGTSEDKEYISTHELKAKQYLWNVYGTLDSKDNRGFEYGVNPDFPETGSNVIIRRTSRSGDVFYIKCEKKDKITVGVDADLKNSSTLKFLAKCTNNCYIFEGVLPTPIEHTGKSTTTSARFGFDKKKRSTKKANKFTQLVNKYHGDYDAAAYDFIGDVANECGVSAVLPHYSSDFVHSAFEICFDDNLDVNVFDEIFSNSQIDSAHEQLSTKFTPIRGKMIDVSQAKKFFDNAYSRVARQAKNGAEANAMFLKALRDIYSKTDCGNNETLSADIASSMVADGSNPSSIVELVESMKNESDEVMRQEIHDDGNITTPMMNILKNKLSSYPFVGFVAKQSSPALLRCSTQKLNCGENNDTVKTAEIPPIPMPEHEIVEDDTDDDLEAFV